jgi:hypothetical protein
MSLGVKTGDAPVAIPGAVRLYFNGVELVYVTPDGQSRVIDYYQV